MARRSRRGIAYWRNDLQSQSDLCVFISNFDNVTALASTDSVTTDKKTSNVILGLSEITCSSISIFVLIMILLQVQCYVPPMSFVKLKDARGLII